MNIRFLSLTLQCRKSVEVIQFSPQISHFHGQISAGKSSIVRLIDYCLGGHLERTPAISQELVSAQLSAAVGQYEVLLERQVTESDGVQVTWQNAAGERASVLIPIQAVQTPHPVWGTDVYNLSDLLFHLSGFTPIKVRRSKQDEDSPLIRLSFRDIMWYCYLEQHTLDSSFYELTDPFRRLKSRDAMRFVTGFYTERMNDLQIQFDDARSQRAAKLETAKQIRKFLEDFGYGTEMDVATEVAATNTELEEARQQLTMLRQDHRAGTHPTDELRAQLRALSDQLANEEQTLEDLRARIEEQESLRAELVSAKFKTARLEAASVVLSGASFECCPACGSSLISKKMARDPATCQLCGIHPEPAEESLSSQAEMVKRDLTSRIDDLAESLSRHSKALSKQENIVAQVRQNKAKLDAQLSTELEDYDSAYLARYRDLERRVATLEERNRGLENTAKMPQAITQLHKEASDLRAEADKIAELLALENKKLTKAESHVNEIEDAYLQCLLRVGVPGIISGDRVQINRRTWMPWIMPEEGDAYTFYDAGSGGKKTLLNVCYALAVHRVAAENGLPLPTFLMIDTPMKNIGEDVNVDIFRAFYSYLYELARGPLSGTQFIIIDKEFFHPDPSTGIEVFDRSMSPDAPLISYYRGP